MGCRDLLLQTLPHGSPRKAVLVPQTLPWGMCTVSVSGLQPCCSQPQTPLSMLCVPVGSEGDAGKAPLSCGAAETSTALRLVFCWSWETGAGCESSGERREKPWKCLPFPWLSEQLMVDENWGSPEHTQGKGRGQEGKQELSKVMVAVASRGVLSWDSSFPGRRELS